MSCSQAAVVPVVYGDRRHRASDWKRTGPSRRTRAEWDSRYSRGLPDRWSALFRSHRGRLGAGKLLQRNLPWGKSYALDPPQCLLPGRQLGGQCIRSDCLRRFQQQEQRLYWCAAKPVDDIPGEWSAEERLHGYLRHIAARIPAGPACDDQHLADRRRHDPRRERRLARRLRVQPGRHHARTQQA